MLRTISNTQTASDISDEMLEAIDFELVRSYMKVRQWTYRDDKEPPTIEKLKGTADYLLTRAYLGHGRQATGGFIANYYTKEKHGFHGLSIEFSLI